MMKKLSAAAFAAVLFCVSTSQASDIKMKRVEDIMSQEASLATMQTMLVRCSSLFETVSEWIATSTKAGSADIAERYKNQTIEMFEAWNLIDEILVKNERKQRLKRLAKQLDISKNTYIQKMQNAKALTGSAFGEKLVKDDLAFCSQWKKVLEVVVNNS